MSDSNSGFGLQLPISGFGSRGFSADVVQASKPAVSRGLNVRDYTRSQPGGREVAQSRWCVNMRKRQAGPVVVAVRTNQIEWQFSFVKLRDRSRARRSLPSAGAEKMRAAGKSVLYRYFA
jgi:hypothetical protein